MPDPMIPGGPAPQMPQAPSQDPSQMPPQQDPSQAEMPPQGDPQQASPDQTPITPEQKQALIDLVNQVRAKLGAFHAHNFAAQNKLETMRSAMLKQVFEKLQMAGVDLTSQESVAKFLMELKQENPELAQNFEKAMEALLGGAPSGPIQPGMATAPQDPNQSTVDLGVPQQQ